MTIKIVTSREDFINAYAEALFEHTREAIEELDKKADEAGMDDHDLSLLILGKLSTAIASYTAYMTAGLYTALGQESLAAGAVKALGNDIHEAMEGGRKLAVVKAQTITEDFKKAETAAEELLKKVMKKWH